MKPYVFLVILFITNCTPSINNEIGMIYLGGHDGGVWVEIKEYSTIDSAYLIIVYTENKNDTLSFGKYKTTTFVNNTAEINNNLSSYDGVRFYSKNSNNLYPVKWIYYPFKNGKGRKILYSNSGEFIEESEY